MLSRVIIFGAACLIMALSMSDANESCLTKYQSCIQTEMENGKMSDANESCLTKYQSCELTCKSAHSSKGVWGEESCFAECEVEQMTCEAKCNEDYQDDYDEENFEKRRKCFGY